MSRSKFLTNYPCGPSYSSLVLIQFQNWSLNQVSFPEPNGIETKLGMGGRSYGIDLESFVGYGKVGFENHNQTKILKKIQL